MLIKKKKGAAPLIATVLIISMVVVGSSIVFLWGRGYTEELIEKGQGVSLSQLNCVNDIKIDIIRHSTDTLTIENKGRGKIDAFTLVEDGVPHDEYTEIEPGNIAEVKYVGSKVAIIPKIRVAQGLLQPCSDKQLIFNA